MQMNYFSKFEIGLWCTSLTLILGSALLTNSSDPLSIFASMLGATAILLGAKGNPIAKCLMLIFCLIYGYISYSFQYYGEMLTYLGMTAPMEVFSLISWVKNPYSKGKAEVKVNQLTTKQILTICLLAIIIGCLFYPILIYFHTENILFSTSSVMTSFLAVFLTYKRSELSSLGYALNDVILIVLWTLATLENIQYLSVMICFIVFLINDMYAYISWVRMRKRQQYRSKN